MTMSDVLQLDCSMHDEIARNATKNFAGTLEKAFKQYKKLWNEYLKLRKYCEDANCKIPFQLFESDDYNNKNISHKDVNTSSQVCGCSLKSPDTSQVMPENTNTSTSVCASVPIIYSSHIVADLDNNISCDDKFLHEQLSQDELLCSPILIKDQSRAKKNNIILSHSLQNSLKNFNEDTVHKYVQIKENFPVLANSPKKNELFNESNKDECSLFSFVENNEEVECTPVAKMPRRLGISKLFNVDTILLKNGKKIKQSKLVFLPSDQLADNRLYSLKSYITSTPEKMIEDRSKNKNQSIDEEIIEVSPNKCTESSLKVKSLKVKRKTSIKMNYTSTKEKNIYDSREAKFPLKEGGQTTLKQNLLSTHTSKEENQLSPLRTSKTFSFLNDHSADIKNFLPPIKKDEPGNVKNINQTGRGSYSESIDQKANSNSLTCEETFCTLGERLKEVPSCDTNKLQTIQENIFKDDRSSVPLSVRRSLMSSFDIPCKRKNTEFVQPSKKKSDRAKMAGVSCWECKQYYTNLGLSEKEIQIRQNQCSRHRTNQKKREDTPEGFWNPLFSGTYVSTVQDNSDIAG